jgi:hypothetical protein
VDPQLRKLLLWTLAALVFTIVVGQIATMAPIRTIEAP